MKFLILLFVFILGLIGGVFYGQSIIRQLPLSGSQPNKVTSTTQIVASSDSGLVVKTTGIGDGFTDIGNGLLLEAREAYPLKGDIERLFALSTGERKGALEKALSGVTQESMAFSSISDVLYGTHYCDTYPQFEKCKEQIEVIRYSLNNENIKESSLDIKSTQLVGLYAHQKKLTQEQYAVLLEKLMKEYYSQKK